MKNTSKNTTLGSTSHGKDTFNKHTEKRNWISPNLDAWESVNIELLGGVGGDGAFSTYA